MIVERMIAGGTALLLLTGLAAAQGLAPAGREPRQVGPRLGDPEKESVGFPAAPSDCPAQPVYTPVAQPVGTPAEDPEKASIGFVLIGERGCKG